MRIDNAGQCIYTEAEAANLIMQGINIDSIYIENGNDLNKALRNYEVKDFLHYFKVDLGDEETFHRLNQKIWEMPEEYYKLDIVNYLRAASDRMFDSRYYLRVDKELAKFEEYNLLDLLRYMYYMVETLRKNNIVWGVGRGSSVASYCLYLLGVHSIDPVVYDIDFEEFLE